MWKVGEAQCCSSLHDLFFWVANLFFLKPFSHIQIALSARAMGCRRPSTSAIEVSIVTGSRRAPVISSTVTG